MSNILIVEDDRRLNEIVYDYLDVDGHKVYQAYNGIEALEVFNKHTIDLVILDIMIPNLDGFSVCRKLRNSSDVLIIIVSARSEEDDKIHGFDLGADEYVTKPFSPKVLLKRVNALLGRFGFSKSLPQQIIRKGGITLDTEGYCAYMNQKPLALTVKEFKILQMFFENEGKVLTRSSLIDCVWGYDYTGTDRVVDTNIKTLRKKLGDASKHIQTVINIGYKFEVKS